MEKMIYIGVAWPYANGSIHLGHVAGCYLPADIFARFHRLIGSNVLMVSGSDEHGTPITITAEKEKTSPQAIVDKYNAEHIKNMRDLGISFDLFTRTTTENHTKVVQEIFLTLYNNGHIYTKSIDSFFCSTCNRFLPDRYVEGTCPYCNFNKARGDQCDECGKLLDPQELLNPQCKICSGIPEIKSSDHFFLALSSFEKRLRDWLRDKTYWKSNVLNFTQNWLKNGLNDRAITRDMDWGVPVPVEEYNDKRIYVWFDAVIGYLAASKEWAQNIGDAEKWKEWWKNQNARHYYFLAKDNIPFHSLIWPTILMGYDETLNLPFDIPANEYLCLRGEHFSKSRGLAIYVSSILEKLNVDAIRYYLSINMPENKDTNWLWDDFISKNNDELVGTYGNFIHRVLTFAYKNFGEIPKFQNFDELDLEALNKIKVTSDEARKSIEKCNFKIGLRTIMNLAQFGNFYFDKKKPWVSIKTDKEKCATTMHVCLKFVKALAVFMIPYLPFSSKKIWMYLGFYKSFSTIHWEDALSELDVGMKLKKPKLLFEKLALDQFMEQEDPFSKLDLRVARIIDVKPHPNAEKLYLLNVDLGSIGNRILVAGIKNHYSEEQLKDKTIVVVTNLKPATIRGVVSRGMLLAAEDDAGTVSLLNPGDVPPGLEVIIEGIKRTPVDILEFEDFKKVNLIVNKHKKIEYNKKLLKTSDGEIRVDKPVREGSPVH